MAVVVRGVPLELHPPGDYVSDRIRATGDFFEAAILDELRKRITGGVLVDAGAMIGNHTVYLAAFVPHTVIHAFEPLPANVDVLWRNAAPYPTVTVHEVALSDRAGQVRMVVDSDNLGHARIPLVGGLIEVDTVTLDSYGLEDVSFVKLDVEGHEPEVLAGGRETIARWRPLILMEDWQLTYGALLPPGYELVRAWPDQQTYLWGPSFPS